MQVSLMIKLIGSCVFVVTGISFTFFSQPEVLSTSSPGSVGFSSSSSYDGINLGLSFQYPANWIKFEAGFDPVFIKDFDGVVSFDIVNDNIYLWRYDLLENQAPAEYHKAQISQLEELYDITGENAYKVYADRFEKYLKQMPLVEE